MGSREVALEFEPLYAAATQAGRRQACQPRCATKAIERPGLAQLAETPLAATTLRQRHERLEQAEREAPLGGTQPESRCQATISCRAAPQPILVARSCSAS